MIHVKDPGLFSTIQDLGRYNYQQDGVVVGGAMDEFSYRIANLLVGNKLHEAAIEVTLIGPQLYFFQDTIISICGAPFQAMIDHLSVPLWRPVLIKKGMTLTMGRCHEGCRAYVAIQGGIQSSVRLHSRSTYVRGKIGGLDGDRLQKNDFLPISEIQALNIWKKKTSSFYTTTWFFSPTYLFRNNKEIRVVDGRQKQWFTKEAIEKFYSSAYQVSNNSDRMGYCLRGEKLSFLTSKELISEATMLGTVQVPPDGQPIVLMADRQTTGGYPKIANVISVDIAKLAQLKAGDRFTFKNVTLQEAQQLLLQKELFFRNFSKRIDFIY